MHVRKMKVEMLKDSCWRKVDSGKVLQGARTQPLHTYIDRRQATVVEKVASRTISYVCAS